MTDALTVDNVKIKNIVEACLLVAGRAMSLRQLADLFEGEDERPDNETLKACLHQLQTDYEDRGIELVNVASGYRLQSRSEMSPWLARLFPEKPPRYSRALLETLVLVAYRQPITRGEIEEIRGVAVSTNIVKTLQERQWVKEVGVKDVPGKPALLGTTRHFLDYFNLKRLDDLPPLSEIKNLDEMDAALMEAHGIAPAESVEAANDETADTEATEWPEGSVRDEGAVNTGNEQPESTASDAAVGTEGLGHTEGAASDEVAASAQAEQPQEAAKDDAVSSTETEQSEGAVYAAGEANTGAAQIGSAEPDQRDAAEHANDKASMEEHTTVDRDGRVDDSEAITFAGLLSSHLPAIEAAGAREGADLSREISDITLVNGEPDAEILAAETSSDQSDAEEKLLSTISEFADEHKSEVEARDELESRLSTVYKSNADVGDAVSGDSDSNPESNEGDAKSVVQKSGDGVQSEEEAAVDELSDFIDASTTSPDVLSDTYTGEPPSTGETLH